jgi:AraC-like DNA-binding protein
MAEKKKSITREEAEEKKGKYNITPKKMKNAPYRQMIRAELADELYDKIMKILIIDKKYRDSDYSASQLAKDLKTNTRYLSAVINVRFLTNYSNLVNEYRIKDAKYLLSEKKHNNLSMDDISIAVGFSNRQSFYAAFYKFVGVTPRDFRLKFNSDYAKIVEKRKKMRTDADDDDEL